MVQMTKAKNSANGAKSPIGEMSSMGRKLEQRELAVNAMKRISMGHIKDLLANYSPEGARWKKEMNLAVAMLPYLYWVETKHTPGVAAALPKKELQKALIEVCARHSEKISAAGKIKGEKTLAAHMKYAIESIAMVANGKSSVALAWVPLEKLGIDAKYVASLIGAGNGSTPGEVVKKYSTLPESYKEILPEKTLQGMLNPQ